MRCGVFGIVAGMVLSSVCVAEPTEVFGGEFAIADGIGASRSNSTVLIFVFSGVVTGF